MMNASGPEGQKSTKSKREHWLRRCESGQTLRVSCWWSTIIKHVSSLTPRRDPDLRCTAGAQTQMHAPVFGILPTDLMMKSYETVHREHGDATYL